MSIKYMSHVLRDRDLDGKQKLILLAIADAVDAHGVGFCSHKQIQQVTQVTTEYIRRCVNQFVDEGRLEIISKGNGPGRATVYRIKLPNSVGEFTRENYPELPNSVGENSPTQLHRTPQLGRGNSPTGAPNPPSYTSLETSPLQTPAPADAAFIEFWTIYPRRAQKAKARKAFTDALKKVPRETILTGAARYRDDPNRKPQYTAHPASWLNAERWDDDPEPTPAPPLTAAQARAAEQKRKLDEWVAEQNV